MPSFNVPVDEEAFCCEFLFPENGLVRRFNGYQLWLTDLHKWIYETWKTLFMDELNIYPMTLGFSVFFDKIEDKKDICEVWPWFQGSVGLFMQSQTPNFDPIMASISTTLVSVRLPNLPLHLCNHIQRKVSRLLMLAFVWR